MCSSGLGAIEVHNLSAHPVFYVTALGQGTQLAGPFYSEGTFTIPGAQPGVTYELHYNVQNPDGAGGWVTSDCPDQIKTFTLEFSDDPNFAPTAGPNQTIYCGESATLGADPCLHFFDYYQVTQYEWQTVVPSGPNPSPIAHPVVTPLVTTTYRLKVYYTDANGTPYTQTSYVTVTPGGVFAGPDRTVCKGQLAQIGLRCGPSATGTTYQWSPTDGVVCPTCSTTYVRPCSTQIYTLTVSPPTGGTHTSSVQVTVTEPSLEYESAPGVWTAAPQTITMSCPGPLSLRYPCPIDPDHASVTWTRLGDEAGTGLDMPLYVSGSGFYQVTVTLFDYSGPSNGPGFYCQFSYIQKVVVATPGPPTSYNINCGGATTLDLGCPYDGVCVQWYPTAGLSNPFIPNPVASPKETTVYHARIAFPDGTEKVYDVTVNVANIAVGFPVKSATLTCGQTASFGVGCLPEHCTISVSPTEGWISPPDQLPVVIRFTGETKYTVDISCGGNKTTYMLDLVNSGDGPGFVPVIPVCDGNKPYIDLDDGDDQGNIDLGIAGRTASTNGLSLSSLDENYYEMRKTYSGGCILKGTFIVLKDNQSLQMRIFNNNTVFVPNDHSLNFSTDAPEFRGNTHFYVQGDWPHPVPAYCDPISNLNGGTPIKFAGSFLMRDQATFSGMCGEMWQGLATYDVAFCDLDINCDRCKIEDAKFGFKFEGGKYEGIIENLDFIRCQEGISGEPIKGNGTGDFLHVNKCLFSAPVNSLRYPFSIDANLVNAQGCGDASLANYGGLYGMHFEAGNALHDMHMSCDCNQYEGLNIGYGVRGRTHQIDLRRSLHTAYNIAGTLVRPQMDAVPNIHVEQEAYVAPATERVSIERDVMRDDLHLNTLTDRTAIYAEYYEAYPTSGGPSPVITLNNNRFGVANETGRLDQSTGITLSNIWASSISKNRFYGQRYGVVDNGDHNLKLSDINGNTFARNETGIYRLTDRPDWMLNTSCNKFDPDHLNESPSNLNCVGIEVNWYGSGTTPYIAKAATGGSVSPYCANVFPVQDRTIPPLCFQPTGTISGTEYNIECGFPSTNGGFTSPPHWTSVSSNQIVHYKRFKNEFVGNVSVPNVLKDVNLIAVIPNDESSAPSTYIPPPNGDKEYVCDHKKAVDDGTSYFPIFTRKGKEKGPSTTTSMTSNDISIFPNPANDKLFSHSTSKARFTILNVTGTKVLEGEISDQTSVDIRLLPVGMYQIVLQDETQVVRKHFAKQ